MATDPMDALRQPLVPMAPSDEFAARLRRRIESELFPTPHGGDTVSTTTTITQNLIPYLAVNGADRAIDWYREVFGAVEVGDRFVDGDGRVGHAELQIGPMRVFLSDAYPDFGVVAPDPAGASVGLLLYVDEVDTVYARGVAAGATGEREPADQPYGDRSGSFRDPFGHRWQISTPIEDVSREELERRLEGSEYELQAPAPGGPEPGKRDGDIGYFTLAVPDVGRAEAFYGALFGWRAVPGSLAEGRHVTNVTPPGGLMGGQERADVTLYFRVTDVQAAATRVRELGGQVLEINEYPSGGNAVCLDDQGLRFELFQPAPGYG